MGCASSAPAADVVLHGDELACEAADIRASAVHFHAPEHAILCSLGVERGMQTPSPETTDDERSVDGAAGADELDAAATKLQARTRARQASRRAGRLAARQSAALTATGEVHVALVAEDAGWALLRAVGDLVAHAQLRLGVGRRAAAAVKLQSHARGRRARQKLRVARDVRDQAATARARVEERAKRGAEASAAQAAMRAEAEEKMRPGAQVQHMRRAATGSPRSTVSSPSAGRDSPASSWASWRWHEEDTAAC
jgi:hypothetical protein